MNAWKSSVKIQTKMLVFVFFTIIMMTVVPEPYFWFAECVMIAAILAM